MFEIIFCDSPLGSGIPRNQYDPNFIVNVWKHKSKEIYATKNDSFLWPLKKASQLVLIFREIKV